MIIEKIRFRQNITQKHFYDSYESFISPDR